MTGEEIRELESFTSFSSDFYPEVGRWAADRITEWADEQIEALDEGEKSTEA